jgi:hypothetical protein
MRRTSLLLLILLFAAALAAAARTGKLKLDVLGELGYGAQNEARLMDRDGGEVARLSPGATIDVPPGHYRLELPIVGGTIRKDDVVVEAGRTATVMIENVAVLDVAAGLRDGSEPGFTVIVSRSKPPHERVATFLTGNKVLFAPSEVDVKVDAPPQGYYWDDLKLEPGVRARLRLNEVVAAELVVQPVMSRVPMESPTRVIVYFAGTQRRAGESGPRRDHRFELDPGNYDVYVENDSGRGKPYATDSGIKLEPGAKVERKVPLD